MISSGLSQDNILHNEHLLFPLLGEEYSIYVGMEKLYLSMKSLSMYGGMNMKRWCDAQGRSSMMALLR